MIVSKDSDFHDLLDRLAPNASMLWVRIGNTVNRVLLARMEMEWPRIERELNAGARFVELA